MYFDAKMVMSLKKTADINNSDLLALTIEQYNDLIYLKKWADLLFNLHRKFHYNLSSDYREIQTFALLRFLALEIS